MKIVGREKEINILQELYNSDSSELVAVYGRRRVGKTYLISNVFEDAFAFKHTGLSPLELGKDKSMLSQQLENFYNSLKTSGMKTKKKPKSWLEAFYMLEQLLKEKYNGEKQVVFIDELPWMDTPKSGFITAFEAFWNGWAYGRNIMVIICGSATSWLLNKIINNHGGLYGRVTYEIRLLPFSLKECEEFLNNKHINYSRYDITQAYMAVGGIPYYLNYFKKEKSLIENIDELFFRRDSVLKMEFDRLFESVFELPELTKSIVVALSKKHIGLTREEMLKELNLKDGEYLYKAINALLGSDFIIKYAPLTENKKKMRYKLIDPFCLFYLKFVENVTMLDENIFANNIASAKIVSYKGIAFENVCFNHIEQIKNALKIGAIGSEQSTLVYKGSDAQEGAQIDLLIARRDNIVNICEIKFYSDVYANDKDGHLALIRRQDIVRQNIKKKQTIRNTLITTYGLKDGEYRWDYGDVLTLDDLFAS